MAILSCHVSIKLPPKISDGQKNFSDFNGKTNSVARMRSEMVGNAKYIYSVVSRIFCT